jgi:multidrug efflux pump subunit AcrB
MIPIVVRATKNERINLDKLENIYIVSSVTGNKVPLTQIANIRFGWQEAKIWRRNNIRCLSVGCATLGSIPSEVLKKVLPEINKIKLDKGYRFEVGGLHEKSQDSSKAVVEPVPLIVLIIFIILTAQFNSLRKTFIILITAVFGIIGALMGLLIFQKAFGFMTLLGILSLSGMIIKNAIVLIDKITFETDNGKRLFKAVIYSSVTRVRPILLAAFTTVLGMLPLAIAGGPMWEAMAIAIMCGLSFATLLTLFFVPVLYLTLFRPKRIRS